MEFLSHPVTQEVIEKGFSYSEFVQLTQQLVEEKRTTGANQSEAYLEYTRMCLQRMNRWNKTAKVSEKMTQLIYTLLPSDEISVKSLVQKWSKPAWVDVQEEERLAGRTLEIITEKNLITEYKYGKPF